MRRVLWVVALLLVFGLIPAIVRSQEADDPHAGHDMGSMGGDAGHAGEEHWHGAAPGGDGEHLAVEYRREIARHLLDVRCVRHAPVDRKITYDR